MTEEIAPGDLAEETSAAATDGSFVSPSVLMSTTTVDPQVVGSAGVHRSKITLRDLKRIIENDPSMSEVTIEQIERVKLMHDKFVDGTVFSFNYNTLLLVASVIAGLGLVSNSTASIIASMLVSPIMGPVASIAYGSTIFDRKLVVRAWTNELVSIAICILVGVIIGACTGGTGLAEDWPTDEMLSRCTWSNFYVGIPTAFFSGLGVAVSLLDDQTNSLVGVAISASLLPPAVNSGIVLVSWYFFDKEIIDVYGLTRSDFGSYAQVSLGLTFVNILMIWISSMLMFRIKEVLPIQKKIFWADLGIARMIYKGKAVLAHQAFDPEPNTTEQLF